MTRTRAHISAVNSYFPRDRVDNAALLEKVTASFPLPNPNILERLCGIRTRHFAAAGEQVSDMFTHQVSESTFHMVTESIGIPPERSVNLFPTHGNMAAASIPACMAAVRGQFRRGDKILLVGLAAGISLSFQAVIW